MFQIYCSQTLTGLRSRVTFSCESVLNKYPTGVNIGSIALPPPLISRYGWEHHQHAVFTLHIKQHSGPALLNESTSQQIHSARAVAATQR